MKEYLDNDVIITIDDELYFYWEAKKYDLIIKKMANKKQSQEYWNEYLYWQKEKSDNEMTAYYHELPE